MKRFSKKKEHFFQRNATKQQLQDENVDGPEFGFIGGVLVIECYVEHAFLVPFFNRTYPIKTDT